MTRQITITLPEYVKLMHYHDKEGELIHNLPIMCIFLEEIGCYGSKQYLYLSMSGNTVFKVKNGKIYQFPLKSAINNYLIYMENQKIKDKDEYYYEDEDEDEYDYELNYPKGQDCEMGRWASKYY